MRERAGTAFALAWVIVAGLASADPVVPPNRAVPANPAGPTNRTPPNQATAPDTTPPQPSPPTLSATEARIAPSRAGALGAWLLVGPFRSATFANKKKLAGPDALAQPPPGVDEEHLAPRLGAAVPSGDVHNEPAKTPRWILASSDAGPIDVKSALKQKESDVVAYAAGTLHVARAGKVLILVGADDGLRLWVDGKVVLTRDESRPFRNDDDLVALDLAAGDHALRLKLHQRDGAWLFRLRVADRWLAPPAGSWLSLPGTTRADAETLARTMSQVSLDRGLREDGYHARLTVQYPEGTPLGVPLGVQARLGRPAVFDVDAGEVPRDTGELVVGLPVLAGADLNAFEGRSTSYSITVAGREVKLWFLPRKAPREVVARADRLTLRLRAERPAWLRPDSLETLEHLRDRTASFVSLGDPDVSAADAETAQLSAALDLAEKGRDPFAQQAGVLRMAYRSPLDGTLQEYGLYVPSSYRAGTARRWPLVVALHGMNGRPLAMLRHFFGGDDPKRDSIWEDRHVASFVNEHKLDAFVVTPGGHGNAMYRELGADDVLRVMERVIERYPIDRDRVTITGPSMGGSGTAALALRKPGVFAAAMPLCGYHSYFVRRDFWGRPIRPWERTIAEERSNVLWAENGARLPLKIVHGTLDLPIVNSGVLIDRYEQLKFNIVHEHPNLGHNVWQVTYEDLKGARWLIRHRRNAHPTHVVFKTLDLRDGDDAWVHVGETERGAAWAEVDARITAKKGLDVFTKNVGEVTFDRDSTLVDAGAPTHVTIDGQALIVPENQAIVLHRDGANWALGAAAHVGPWKRRGQTGPLRDVFHEPILFVYGATDPEQRRANEEVAHAWAAIRPGVHIQYPVLSDTEFLARNEALANDKALFLVGNAKSNAVVRALEAELPIKVDGLAITMGRARFTGAQLGAAFVRPNPRRPDRYVVVVEGVDALGTWRSLSLPDLLPDFVVYDESVAPARGQMLLGAGRVRAGGFFENDWSLPANTDDPFANVARPGATSEHDATPYLP